MASASSCPPSEKQPSNSPLLKSPLSPDSRTDSRFMRSITQSFAKEHSPSSSTISQLQRVQEEELVHRPRASQRFKDAVTTNFDKLKTIVTKMNSLPLPKRNGRLKEKIVIDLISEDEDEDEFNELEDNIYNASPGPQSPIRQHQNLIMDNGPAAPFQPVYPPPFEQLPNPYIPPNMPQDREALDPDAFWEDYALGELDDDALNELIMGGGNLQPDQEAGPYQQFAQPASPIVISPNADILQESLDECIASISALFPGICPEHVSNLFNTISKSSELLIQYILDNVENGTPYPTIKDKQNTLKRKRVVDEDEELIKKFSAVDRIIPGENRGTRTFVEKLLGCEFARTPMNFINATLDGTGHRLFPAYRVLEEAERTFDPQNPPYNKIKSARKVDKDYKDLKKLMSDLAKSRQSDEIAKLEVLNELQAARKLRDKAEAKRQAERDEEVAEQANAARAKAEGTMGECGCCYGDYPLNRMVHCDGDPFHWFCRECALRNAEEEIGKSKYELICMSTDNCAAGFMADQRAQFLDENTKIALERNEQESNLRLAGIENLASCPYCPYAAEYPPVEIDHEFHCQAPDCEKVSCRLCKLESHIPKSCEEHAKDNGLSIRRQIEEAMSAALIRRCNKCSTPFVKEEGCNKMTCTRNGCFNIQCYVCSKSCSYDHFDDTGRGGRAGNCPLFESVEQRHEGEVSKAEKEALAKVLADHPEYTEEDLKVKMSENVAKDDAARKARDPRARPDMPAGPGHALGALFRAYGPREQYPQLNNRKLAAQYPFIDRPIHFGQLLPPQLQNVYPIMGENLQQARSRLLAQFQEYPRVELRQDIERLKVGRGVHEGKEELRMLEHNLFRPQQFLGQEGLQMRDYNIFQAQQPVEQVEGLQLMGQYPVPKQQIISPTERSRLMIQSPTQGHQSARQEETSASNHPLAGPMSYPRSARRPITVKPVEVEYNDGVALPVKLGREYSFYEEEEEI